MNWNTWKTFAQPASKAMVAVMVATALVFAVGCGGGASSAASPNPTPTPGTAAANNAQVRFGDAPADSVISFEVTVSALTLTPSGGGAAVSIPGGANNRIELS